jgi:WG containing repeat
MVVDATGKRLTPEIFNTPDAQPYDGMIRTVQRIPDKHEGDWFYGFINIRGQVIVPAVYTYKHKLSRFNDGLASVCDPKRGCGYLAPDGSWAIPMRSDWTDAHDFHHGLALVRGPGFVTDSFPMSSVGPIHIKQPWSVIDKSGRIVMGYDPADQKTSIPSAEELLRHRRFDLFKLPKINIESDFIDGYAVFSPGIPAAMAHNMGYGMVDTKGRIVVQPSTKHYRETELREAYFPVQKSEPSAALRKKFYVVDNFHEGLARAIKSHRVDRYGSNRFSGTGFIDRQGRWVIAPRQDFELEIPFRDGNAVVRIYEPAFGYTSALMNRTGRIVANYRLLLGKT